MPPAGTSFCVTYKKDAGAGAFLGVGGMLAFVFSMVLGAEKLMQLYPMLGQALGITFVLALLGFVVFKMGRRVGTALELFRALTLRGHWYLMPLVVVLIMIGSLLVVAASSLLIAPFIYTLF